ncbi:MAG: hypothetical protein ACE5H1_06950 [Thermodesulfobacteriota bacterium]
MVQLFNPETSKITYKCKSEQAYLKIDAFEGIVKFNKKGAKAIVAGPKTSIDDCTIINEDDSEFKQALNSVIESEIKFKKENINKLNQDINELSKKTL